MVSVPLLGPHDPPAFEIENPHGRGRLLLLCDHASAAIPRRLHNLGLPPVELTRHIAYDIGAAAVARRLSAAFDAPLVLSGYSRLVVDCNRSRADATAMPPVSDGVIVPGNQSLSDAERNERWRSCFEPYHTAVAQQLAALVARPGPPPAVISVHSCTPVMGGVERPWHIGVLWDRDDRLPRPLMAALATDPDICVGDNQPYSGRDGHGYTIINHVEPLGLPHALLEIRQDLISDLPGIERWSDKLIAALGRLIPR